MKAMRLVKLLPARAPSALLIMLTLTTVEAQVRPLLDQDPVFSTVLARCVNFPPRAAQAGVCATVYTTFRIDSMGHIQDVAQVKRSRLDYGFEQSVSWALRRMPPLRPAYAGTYLLPVSFSFVRSKQDSDEADKTLPSVEPVIDTDHCQLLTALRVETYRPQFMPKQTVFEPSGISGRRRGSTGFP